MSSSIRMTLPEKFVYPLEFYGNTPFLRGALDGVEGLFLFDSGGQSFALNSRRLSSDMVMRDAGGVMGVTGKAQSYFVKMQELAFGDWRISNLEVMAMDFSHIEEDYEVEFLGVLSFRELMYFDWMVDYKAAQLHLWERFPKNDFLAVEKVRSIYHNHLPGIQVRIGGETYTLFVDTGADILCFDKYKQDKIASLVRDHGSRELQSSSPDTLEVERGILEGFSVGKIDFGPAEMTFIDLKHMQERFGDFDGIIGFHLLSKYRTVVSWNSRGLIFLED